MTLTIVDARPAMASTIVDARPERVKLQMHPGTVLYIYGLQLLVDLIEVILDHIGQTK